MKRFFLVLERDLRLRRAHYLSMAGGYFTAEFLSQCMAYFSRVHHHGYAPAMEESFNADAAAAALMVAGFIFLCYNSLAFSHLSTKGGRQTELMLPASSWVKLSEVLLIYVPVSLAVAFLAVFVGDALRMLVFALWGYPYGSAMPAVFHHIGYCLREATSGFHLTGDSALYGFLDSLSMILFILNIWVSELLGGLLFCRRPTLYTNIVIFGVLFVLFVVTDDMPGCTSFVRSYPMAAQSLSTLVGALFFGGLCWVFLRRFRCRQVV